MSGGNFFNIQTIPKLTGNASPSDVRRGKEFYSNNPRIKQTGTYNPRLLKVGSVSFNYGYSKNTTATLNIASSYSHYRDLTVDDICFPVTNSRGWFEDYPNSGGSATLSGFKKSYNSANGLLTITAQGGYNYCNTSFSCDIYVIDRFN